MIYIKNAKRLKNEKFNDFFKRVFLSNFYYIRTYKDKECLITQCGPGCYRSFEDIVKIAQTYYPNITDKKVAKSILEFEKSHSFLFCPLKQKWMLTNYKTNCDIPFLFNYDGCKDFTNRVTNHGRYSFDMIKELINKK
jgi:hypothetical protein